MLSYRGFLFFWVAVLGLFVIIAKMRQREAADLGLYASRINGDRLVYDARKLCSNRISAAFHSSDVGTNDHLTVHFVWRNDGLLVYHAFCILRTLMSHKNSHQRLKWSL